jgi:uncharacterized protein
MKNHFRFLVAAVAAAGTASSIAQSPIVNAASPASAIEIIASVQNKAVGASTPNGIAKSDTPMSFTQTTITVDAAGDKRFALQGILTLPQGAGPFPVVVLVHGSGPGDRDLTSGPNKPFRDIADGLAAHGIASIRYDKRASKHGAEMLRSGALTLRAETIDDAVAAAMLAKGVSKLNADRVVIVGISQGALLAPRIAEQMIARGASPAGLVMLATPTTPLHDTIVRQVKFLLPTQTSDQSVIDDQIKKIVGVRDMIDAFAKKPNDQQNNQMIMGAPLSFWGEIVKVDPVSDLQQLKVPALLVYGERDYQVPPSEAAPFNSLLAQSSRVQLKMYATLNHLMMPGSGTPGPAEYNNPNRVSTELINDIAAWVKAR